jgi:hypothetical protein
VITVYLREKSMQLRKNAMVMLAHLMKRAQNSPWAVRKHEPRALPDGVKPEAAMEAERGIGLLF